MTACLQFAIFGLVCIMASFATESTEMRMPGIEPSHGEQYLCRSLNVSTDRSHYIIGFTPHASMHIVHHMLLYGCITPGSGEKVWDCGEMQSDDKNSKYHGGSVCGQGSQIVYAWARDAPEFKLPEGVGFKTGGDTEIRHLVLQVHYMHEMAEPDYSGLTIHSTAKKMPKEAAVLLMGTGGMIKAHSSEKLETACIVDDPNIELHPFAFRTHTHKHGRVVSGYKVDRQSKNWELIGKKDPMLPEMFYPVEDSNLVIKTNDILAARCTMVNEEDRDVYIGGTGNDEMCNFYMMYWTSNGEKLSQNTCFSSGPPDYSWGKQAKLKNIPDKEASTL